MVGKKGRVGESAEGEGFGIQGLRIKIINIRAETGSGFCLFISMLQKHTE